MKFDMPGAAYDRFMGRYSMLLAPLFADFARITPGMRVLDVGCGPGSLTLELSRRLGSERVCAIEPAALFADACRARVPGADVRTGAAEQLPWGNAEFDAALAQLVVSFMADADIAVREMRRVVRPGGTVAACMWKEGDALEMSHLFWRVAEAIDPHARGGDHLRYRTDAELRDLWRRADLQETETTLLAVRVTYADFDDLWQSIAHGAGSVGAYMAKADAERQAAIREGCRQGLGDPQGSFELSGRACAIRGRA